MNWKRSLAGSILSLVVLSGCGGGSVCERLDGAVKDSTKRLATCTPGGAPTDAEIEAAFDEEACEQRVEAACTDEQADLVAEFYECAFDKMTCEALASDDEEALVEQMMACAEKGLPNLNCLGAVIGEDVTLEGGPGLRKALRSVQPLQSR
jgi:hypothetical protein